MRRLSLTAALRPPGRIAAVKSWNLREIETPDGSRSPVVLHSDEARAVLIELKPGQELGDHEVKEQAFLTVIDGRVHVESADATLDAEAGTLFVFDPTERHSVSSEAGARLLLLLAPWPGEGHYRGDDRSV
jgi:quercetin dioxygenase-like cupin family protein